MKKFLVSRNIKTRLDFINKIKGKKIAIYNGASELLKHFDLAIDMHKLMKGDYFLENLAKCDGNTTVVLIDVLIKNGIYAHPYGKIFAFTEQAREIMVIDSFAFKWDEKQIVRPFLFINPSILGASMINFFEGKSNTIENYVELIRPYINMDTQAIKITTHYWVPSKKDKSDYEKLKKELITDLKNTKPKIVNSLIDFVDGMQSKKDVVSNVSDMPNRIVIRSNKPSSKFDVYEKLRDPLINEVVFFSANKEFGADEIELHRTKFALERHNILIKLINGK